MNNPYNLKFGEDPEFFGVMNLPDVNYDPAFLPGGQFAVPPAAVQKMFGFVPLNDDTKHPLYYKGNGFNIIGDGVAWELNFTHPFNDPIEMWKATKDARDEWASWMQDKFGLLAYSKPTVNFDYKTWWNDENMKDPYMYWSTIFGCDPDKDAFNVDWLAKVVDHASHPHRYGGGHIHISGVPELYDFPVPAVKLMAGTVGAYYVAHAHDPELDKERAKHYGKPGKFRSPEYSDGSKGLEYRSPANGWVDFTQGEIEEMFDLVNKAVYLLKHRDEGMAFLNKTHDDVVSMFTTFNQELAKSYLKENCGL
jgi:hypothetical protein